MSGGSLGEAVRLLASARKVVALTGAGISAESGIPTFRGRNGLWKDEAEVEALATYQGFRRDPGRVWGWYHERRRQVASALPNPGHRALAALEGRFPSFTLVTQNIDGLHQAAGSRRVLELHGSILRARCEGCGGRSLVEDGVEGIPACPGCGGRLRPDVVWFGEPLPGEVLERAFASAGDADLFLLAGTSALVQPAASLPLLALRSGARLLEVNLEETPLTPRADVSLRGRTGELLPVLLQALQTRGDGGGEPREKAGE